MKYLLLMFTACGEQSTEKKAQAVVDDTAVISDTGASTNSPEPFFPPDVPGPFEVVSIEAIAESRYGFDLPLQIWFPAAEWQDSRHAYLGLVSGKARASGVPDCQSQRPVVLMSHGNKGTRVQMFFMAEHLASHGYVVLAPDHVYNTFLDHDGLLMYETIFRRPHDLSDSYDQFIQHEDFVDCVDENAGFAVVGVELGGYTSLAIAGAAIDSGQTAAWCAQQDNDWLCDEVAAWEEQQAAGIYNLSDPRVWAALPMAPAGYEAVLGGLAAIDLPVAILAGALDTQNSVSAQAQPIFAGMQQQDRYLGVFSKMGHLSFGHDCALGFASLTECDVEYLDPEIALPLVQTIGLAFFEKSRGKPYMDDYLPPDTLIIDWITAE